MKTIYGDLIKLALEGKFDVIIHGCNCFHTMGSGIAKQIKLTFPEAYTTDCKTAYGDKKKLGTISVATTRRKNRDIVIINAYTQFDYGREKGRVYVYYEAVSACFDKIANLLKSTAYRIGYPQIGCGLAGGKWGIVGNIIDEKLSELDHTLVLFQR